MVVAVSTSSPLVDGYAGHVQSILEVGSRLDADLSWPEGVTLTMPAGEPAQLRMSLRRPHELEIRAVTTAPTQFAWVDGEHVAILAYRLGPIMPWSTTTYSPHLDPAEPGPPGDSTDPTVRIVLVDRDDSTVQAVNTVRWPDEFAAAVHASVTRMRELPFSHISYDHVLASLHRRFPSPEDLIVDRAEAQCVATPVPGHS
jgi:hypothetical protein